MTTVERPTLLVLVRHAESARNVAKKGNRFFLDDESRKAVQGVADHLVPITDEGRRQADLTGRALRSDFGGFDYVYHSGYRRTQETAEHLLAAYTDGERKSMRVRHHLFLRERDAGWTYDMTTSEAEAAFPWLQGYWETFGRFFAQPPGGESLAEVAARVYLFLGMLFRDRATAADSRREPCRDAPGVSLPARAMEPRRVHRAMGIRTRSELRRHELCIRP